MTGPTVLHVRSDRSGHDTDGDGSCQRPFRTIARAISEDPGAAIIYNDTISTVPPRPLTHVGEERPAHGEGYVVVLASAAAFVVGWVTQSAPAAVLAAVVIIIGALLAERVQR